MTCWNSRGLVIVGVDGSASSPAAAETAAREALSRGAGLRVVHAFALPAPLVSSGASAPGPPEAGLRNAADLMVTEAVERAPAVAPHLDVSRVVINGEPLTVLEAQSRAADLVVVGSRGVGGFIGLLTGSKAVHLAAHGSSPVLVVREPPHSDGPIVLGVDGSAAGHVPCRAGDRGRKATAGCAGPGASGRTRPWPGPRSQAPEASALPWGSPGRFGPAGHRPRRPANPVCRSSACLSGGSWHATWDR